MVRLPTRFWRHVVRTHTCWIWTGAKTVGGYGYLSHVEGRGQHRGAHRLAYEAFIGPIPEGLTIDHLCRVRACVNPMHLEPCTRGENTKRGGNAIKTHCPQGHPYAGANLYVHANGRRGCRTCRNRPRVR